MKRVTLFQERFCLLAWSILICLPYPVSGDTPLMPSTADEIIEALSYPDSPAQQSQAVPTESKLKFRGTSQLQQRGPARIVTAPDDKSASELVLAPTKATTAKPVPDVVVKTDTESSAVSLDGSTLPYEALVQSQPMTAALIHFDFDSAQLQDDAYLLLDEYVKALRGGLSNIVLIIAGHTDSKGVESYNLTLSRRRAKAVKDYLVNHGIESERLIIKAYGEAHPIASNATDEGRSLNRRSEFIRIGSR